MTKTIMLRLAEHTIADRLPKRLGMKIPWQTEPDMRTFLQRATRAPRIPRRDALILFI